jgi:hypothetical protein
VPLVYDSVEVETVCFSCGPSNQCHACVATRVLSALFSLDQRGVFLLCFQLNSCIHNFLQGHVECRGFISSMCIRNANSSLFVVMLNIHKFSHQLDELILRYRTSLLEQVVRRDLLFFHQIFYLFSGTRVLFIH